MPITQTADVRARFADAAQSTVALSQATMIADGRDFTIVTVTALDALGDPVPGQRMTISVSGTGNIIQQPTASARTDAAGQIIGTFRTTVAETKTVSATIDPVGAGTPVLITQTQNVTANPPPP